ncbi:MAG: hypothetical protein ACC644_05400 [Candidatus Hydrothermarchaeales archaeon]
MAQPKITGLATPGDLDLGDVQEEDPVLERPLVNMPLPSKDSTQTIALDYLGMIRTITVRGYMQKSSVADLKTWIETVYTYMNGPSGFQKKDAGTQGYSYVSDLLGTINVKITYFNAPIKAAQLPETEYVLKLQECKAL